MIDRNSFLDVRWLQANHQKIHWFGLGFIQVKLNDRERLHFYNPLLERTTTSEEVHNHRYNFTSTILGGELFQEIYEFFPDLHGEFVMVQESCQEGGKAPQLPFFGNLIKVHGKSYCMNDSYYIHHETLHKVGATWAITYLERGNYKKEFADVIFPKNTKTVCPFSIKVPDSKLWDVIKQTIHRC